MGDLVTKSLPSGAFLKHLRLNAHGLTLVILAGVPADQIGGVFLQFHTKLAKERAEYPFSVRNILKKGSACRLTAWISLDEVPLKSLTWDTVIRLSSGEELGVHVSYRYRLYLSFLYPGRYPGKDGNLFRPGNTRDGMLSFQYRPKAKEETVFFHLKEIAAWSIYHLFKPFWDRRNIELVYEKFCMTAQDNGYYYFLYRMHEQETLKKRKVFYVIDRKAPDRKKLLAFSGNLIDFLSLRHMVYMQAARLLVSTDTRMQCYALRAQGSLLKHSLRKKPFVFLQHGVTALKKVDFFYGKGQGADCNLFIVTSRMEKDIVEKNFGYRPDEVEICGFARWDVLKDCSAHSREILIMPTWRTWLENADPAEFARSDYCRMYSSLLCSGEFGRMLEEMDLTVSFYLHSKFRDFLGEFTPSSPRISLVPFGLVPVNELIMRCKVLVTDYSSVCWDVLYLGKPVVFFQFDREQYLEAHGSYLDLEKDLFGWSALDIHTLTEKIREIAGKDFTLSREDEEIRKTYFPRQDTGNCERIAGAIEARWP